MFSILGFLAILAPLVIVHELGHYLFAKLFGVRAEVFSVGFGPKIYSKKVGETDWRLSAIPLGGYVKLFGEEPGMELSEEEKKRALQYQEPWKRFFIYFGGPLFNFLFAIIVFMAILAIGEPQLASVAGRVVAKSEAFQAGFRNGDEILSIGDREVSRFREIAEEIRAHPGKSVRFRVKRTGVAEPVVLDVTPSEMDGYSMYGEEKVVGKLDGLLPIPRATQVGISNPESKAGRVEIKTGDEVIEFDGNEVQTWEEMERYYAAAPVGKQILVRLRKADTGTAEIHGFTKTREVQEGVDGIGEDWGLHSSELFIEKVVSESPAEAAKIPAGARIVEVSGEKIHSFYSLRETIGKKAEADKTVQVAWEFEGKTTTSELTPTATVTRDALLKKNTDYTIGVYPLLALAEPRTVVERIWNPFLLLYRGTARMLDFTWRNLVSIGKMITGDVSVATLGGPILIGKIAGDSIQRGLISFLNIMAILSVGLGILNVLPIPVLDGGHLLLLGIESIRGRPLTLRQMEIVQQVGLSLILLLMVVVMRNDLARLSFFN